MDPAAQPLLATAEHDHEADGRIAVVPGNGNKHAEDAEAEEMSTSMQSRLEESSTASAGAGDEADEDEEMASRMQQRLDALPGKPHESEPFTIFRVAGPMRDRNRHLYEPQMVSVGPFHRGAARLRAMEEHKWRYLRDLLARGHEPLASYARAARALEPAARRRYAEPTEDLRPRGFAEMLLLDGCFIIEFWRGRRRRRAHRRRLGHAECLQRPLPAREPAPLLRPRALLRHRHRRPRPRPPRHQPPRQVPHRRDTAGRRHGEAPRRRDPPPAAPLLPLVPPTTRRGRRRPSRWRQQQGHRGGGGVQRVAGQAHGRALAVAAPLGVGAGGRRRHVPGQEVPPEPRRRDVPRPRRRARDPGRGELHEPRHVRQPPRVRAEPGPVGAAAPDELRGAHGVGGIARAARRGHPAAGRGVRQGGRGDGGVLRAPW
ncbi:hypothetical protein VPH35_123006 [Triticum aestivum]